MSIFAKMLAIVAAGVLIVQGAAEASEPAVRPVAPLVDHHMHIQSIAVSTMMREIKAKAPDAFKGISDDVFAVRTGTDALRELDRAGIRQGVLLSAGYMFGSPMLQLDPAEAARRMHAENQYNVDAALASHGRLIAFVGVNPIAANAIDELAYWSRQPGASGVKLHLGNSQFDFDSTEQMEKLAAFFRAASVAKMPLIVHTRGTRGFTPRNVRRFIDTVLSQAGDLPIQIAHGGGYGGVDAATLDALAAYGDAIARKAPGTRNLVFDISAVVQLDLGETPEKRAEHVRDYVASMRKIGLNRFVLASDWPGLHPPAEYFSIERTELPVTDREWRQLCRNRAGYLLPAWLRKKNSRLDHVE